MGIYAAAAGAIMGAGGTWLAGNAADARKRHLTDIANTPGVNVTDTYGDALGGMESSMAQAQRIAGQNNDFSQSELMRNLNQSIPGYSELQGARSKQALSLLNGDIPDDVAAQIQRRTAGQALAGGYGGSEAGRNLTARDLGLTSLQNIQTGMQDTQGILGSTPLARLQSSQDLLSINPSQVFNTREGERNKKMDMLTGVGQMPGKSDIWAQYLQSTGASLSSLGSGGGGMGGSSSGATSAAGIIGAFCWVARAAYGPTNHRWVMFRLWLATDAPRWLWHAYRRWGARYAAFISERPRWQAATRFLMDRAIS